MSQDQRIQQKSGSKQQQPRQGERAPQQGLPGQQQQPRRDEQQKRK